MKSKPATVRGSGSTPVADTKPRAPSDRLAALYGSKTRADRQAAIEEALRHYEINYVGVQSVSYDPSLDAHGSTSRNGVVRIGPGAFDYSPGWLGSTLAHEIEVHFRLQAQRGRWWTDPQGFALQEVQAYDYDLSNAARFSLSTSEIRVLKETRAFYFNQLNPANRVRAELGNFTSYSP